MSKRIANFYMPFLKIEHTNDSIDDYVIEEEEVCLLLVHTLTIAEIYNEIKLLI